jgi:hypothetical protein
VTAADPVLFAQTIILADAAGTDVDGIDVRIGRLENTDVPPVILLEDAGWIRSDSLPAFLPARVSVTAYGRSESEASLLLRAAMDILHRAGPRVIDGIGLWRAYDETGPQSRDDPDTRWPARFTVAALFMPDVALAVVS